MKVVLDVGQFVSAIINSRGHPAQIIQAWHNGDIGLVTSLPILEDLRRVLFYPHIRKRHHLTDEEIRLLVDSLTLSTTVTAGELEVDAVDDDPSDNKILSCAIEGQADYVVASDEHLARLGSFSGIPIVPPRRFLEILERERGSKHET